MYTQEYTYNRLVKGFVAVSLKMIYNKIRILRAQRCDRIIYKKGLLGGEAEAAQEAADPPGRVQELEHDTSTSASTSSSRTRWASRASRTTSTSRGCRASRTTSSSRGCSRQLEPRPRARQGGLQFGQDVVSAGQGCRHLPVQGWPLEADDEKYEWGWSPNSFMEFGVVYAQ